MAVAATIASETVAAVTTWRLGAMLCEALFYGGAAVLWMVTIQWDLLDRWLGGPGMP